MTEEKVYEEFFKWLGTALPSFPPSDDYLVLVKARYTPEDAALLTNIPFEYRTLEELASLKKMTPEELGPRLDALAKKGVVWKIFNHGANRYRLCDPFLVFFRSVYWSGGRNSEHYVMAPLFNKTFGPHFEIFAHCHTRGLRTLPIEKAIDDTRGILPFEDVLKVLDDQDFFCVGHCSCKTKHNLAPDHANCTHYPFEENCVHFGDFARYMVENGHGRELTREECRDLLLKCAESGLVHGVSNWMEPVDTICNCCKCCCMWLKAYHQHGHGKSLDLSNYRASINAETCKGCGLCVKRCPMEALKLEDSPQAKNKTGQASVLEPDLCIGCGVCAFKCPSESIVLERRKEITEPPANMEEFATRFMKDMANPLPKCNE